MDGKLRTPRRRWVAVPTRQSGDTYLPTAPEAAREGHSLFGYVDSLSPAINGWAVSFQNSAPILQIEIGGRIVAVLRPSVRREDVSRLFGIEGLAGFNFPLRSIHPSILGQIDREFLSVTVRFMGESRPLSGPAHEQSVDLSQAIKSERVSFDLQEIELLAPAIRCVQIAPDELVVEMSKAGEPGITEFDIYLDDVFLQQIVVPRRETESFSLTPMGERFELKDLPISMPEAKALDFAFVLGSTRYFLRVRVTPPYPSVAKGRGLGSLRGPHTAAGIEDIIMLSSRQRVLKSRGLALFAIHGRRKQLSSGQLTILASLRAAGFAVCVINSYPFNAPSLKTALSKTADILIPRVDFARDIGSWVAAIIALRSSFLEKFERILLINDSIVGPVSASEPAYDFLMNSKTDLTGLTDSYQKHYHLQSSILSIKTASFQNQTFWHFFQNYSYPNEKDEVILKGEIALSRYALEAGLTLSALARYELVLEQWLRDYKGDMELLKGMPEYDNTFSKVIGDKTILSRGFVDHMMTWYSNTAGEIRAQVPRNAQHTFWNTLISRFNYPFIKRELLVKNPEGVANLCLLGRTLPPSYVSQVRQLLQEVFIESPGLSAPVLEVPQEG